MSIRVKLTTEDPLKRNAQMCSFLKGLGFETRITEPADRWKIVDELREEGFDDLADQYRQIIVDLVRHLHGGVVQRTI